MKRTTALFFAALMLFLTGFPAQAQSADNISTAKVVFYRAANDGGKAYSLTSQNQELAKLKKGEKFEQLLGPGTYYYMADPSSKQVFRLDAVAGQTYYVRVGKDGNFFNGQPSLFISTAQQYERDLAEAD